MLKFYWLVFSYWISVPIVEINRSIPIDPINIDPTCQHGSRSDCRLIVTAGCDTAFAKRGITACCDACRRPATLPLLVATLPPTKRHNSRPYQLGVGIGSGEGTIARSNERRFVIRPLHTGGEYLTCLVLHAYKIETHGSIYHYFT